ncbi:MAG: UDP-2,3-diacylglucosamine diphosphatase [Methylophilus sp.]|jgi:UDP-2,3-diacylglucosamine hydrolase
MAFTLFISDLHLCESRPAITSTFVRWLLNQATQAEALYILGDFFEYWAGDDALQPSFHQPIMQALKQTVELGTTVYLMHGNRDFLMGADFATATGVTLLADPRLISLYGKTVLLMHGDTLCTDDLSYMAFRQQVREPSWQAQFLSQTVAIRQSFIEQARKKSESDKSTKAIAIMDVNNSALESVLRHYHYPEILIHGHTHKPMLHRHEFAQHACQRYVLGDWYEQGSCLKMTDDGVISTQKIT